VAGLQGGRVTGWKGIRVARWQGDRVTRWQGNKIKKEFTDLDLLCNFLAVKPIKYNNHGK